MTAVPDPEYGELQELVNLLDAMQAEMITSDLRDLRIPAVMTKQLEEVVDPDTGEAVTTDTGMFQILVPEAFADIATEVLGVTHVKSEGHATEDQILADLQEEHAPVTFDDEDDPPSLLRSSNRAGRWVFTGATAIVGAAFLTILLRTCAN